MDLFRNLISEISSFLKPKTFKRQGYTFISWKSGVWQLIDFQKSKSRNKDGYESFTINVGICSSVLYHFFSYNQTEKPQIEDCHWRKRVGFLLPVRRDYWWAINDEIDIMELKNEIFAIIEEKILPELDKYSSDESLEKMWVNKQAEGITEVQRYKYLTVLLKKSKSTSFQKVSNEFREFAKGRTFEITAIEHLKELEND